MITRTPAGSTAKAAGGRFSGHAWVDTSNTGAGAGKGRLAAAHFSPGARTAWHSRSRGQTPDVTEGSGLVQDREGHTTAMRPGDTVYTPPVLWHWHGAMPDHIMTHLALADGEENPGVADVDWRNLVVNADYDTAVSAAMRGAERRWRVTIRHTGFDLPVSSVSTNAVLDLPPLLTSS